MFETIVNERIAGWDLCFVAHVVRVVSSTMFTVCRKNNKKRGLFFFSNFLLIIVDFAVFQNRTHLCGNLPVCTSRK